MLVFTRRAGESIVINGDIEVTVVRIGPNDVRIGIVAPAEIPVARNELSPGDVQEIRIGQCPSTPEPRIANRW